MARSDQAPGGFRVDRAPSDEGHARLVDLILSRIDGLARVIEWHEDRGRLLPGTFEIEIPLVTQAGAAGGARAQAAIVDDIITAVERGKAAARTFDGGSGLTLSGSVAVQSVARLANFTRDDAELVTDPSTRWEDYIQTEDGEPIQAETGSLLDTAP